MAVVFKLLTSQAYKAFGLNSNILCNNSITGLYDRPIELDTVIRSAMVYIQISIFVGGLTLQEMTHEVQEQLMVSIMFDGCMHMHVL